MLDRQWLLRRSAYPINPDRWACLPSCRPGGRAAVVGTAAQATSALASRLNQLGFRPKAQVDVIRRAPLGDPTIYRVQDTELCLRRREAQLIEVVPEPG